MLPIQPPGTWGPSMEPFGTCDTVTLFRRSSLAKDIASNSYSIRCGFHNRTSLDSSADLLFSLLGYSHLNAYWRLVYRAHAFLLQMQEWDHYRTIHQPLRIVTMSTSVKRTRCSTVVARCLVTREMAFLPAPSIHTQPRGMISGFYSPL